MKGKSCSTAKAGSHISPPTKPGKMTKGSKSKPAGAAKQKHNPRKRG